MDENPAPVRNAWRGINNWVRDNAFVGFHAGKEREKKCDDGQGGGEIASVHVMVIYRDKILSPTLFFGFSACSDGVCCRCFCLRL